MKKFFGILFVVMTVVTLLAIPALVSAETVPSATSGFEKVKWQDNPNSWYLYLQNWGRTPTDAMSRLAGMSQVTGVNNVSVKNALCGTAGQCSTCPTVAMTQPAWGVSLGFANKSWAGADVQKEVKPRTWNAHPNHFGTGCCTTAGVCGTCSGGDWGVSGCTSPAPVASTWCLTNNLSTGGSSTCLIKK